MIHCEEQASHGGEPLHFAIVRRLLEQGAAGATVVVDELTREAGLVTSELVPAAHAVKARPAALALASTRAR